MWDLPSENWRRNWEGDGVGGTIRSARVGGGADFPWNFLGEACDSLGCVLAGSLSHWGQVQFDRGSGWTLVERKVVEYVGEWPYERSSFGERCVGGKSLGLGVEGE